jgi:hypothetical protein
MLKYTNVNLELLTDSDMHLLFERGIRGGVSQCSLRMSIANNKYMNNYVENIESKYLFYIDANNLYGYAMVDYMPLNNFKWLSEDEINEFTIDKILSISDSSDIGYVFECDLLYPNELHNNHKEYPLAPEKLKVPTNCLSDYQLNLLDLMKINVGYKRTVTEKLMLTLYDKNNYIIHYKNLKLYLELGLKIKKIHRILSFNQSKWLKSYIDLNTSLRQKSTNDFESDLFKLLSNSIYGKSVQDKRHHLDIRCVLNVNHAKRLIKKPNFDSFQIIDENKVLIKMKKNSITLDKPIYVGFSVLELSKKLMYDYHYNVFKPFYKNNIKLCYTDTDSFIYEIKTDDLYKDLQTNDLKHYFDFSNYPKEHHLFNTKKKKVLGFLKDENASKPIIEFIGLKSKLYSILTETDTKKTAKGLQRIILKKYISHDDYKNCLDNTIILANTRRIQSKNQEIFTVKVDKMIYTPFDDKRFILNDGINSLPFGHKDIVNQSDEM